MKIICPKCHSGYNVDQKHILKNGRKVQCFVCKSLWVQYPTGKKEKTKELKDFIDQIKIRQDSIRASLNLTKTEDILLGQKVSPSINRADEKDLLSVLAMGELQENQLSPYDNKSLDPNKNDESEEIGVPLPQEKKELEAKNITERKLNKTFVGFSLISVFILTGLILYTNRNLINMLDPRYHEHLTIFLTTTDILIDQIQNYIIVIKNYLFFQDFPGN